MAHHDAQSHAPSDSRDELSRRTFIANATLAIGGMIGLTLTVPLAGSLVPKSMIDADLGHGTWIGLPKDGLAEVDAKAGTPIRLNITFDHADGYFKAAPQSEFVWGVKLLPKQAEHFKANRPDLFATPNAAVTYEAIVMNYVVFSSICPHLGCRVLWHDESTKFICPCHGSEFDAEGGKLKGPAPRGLDPLPFRERNGMAQVTWIRYKADAPDRVLIAYA